MKLSDRLQEQRVQPRGLRRAEISENPCAQFEERQIRSHRLAQRQRIRELPLQTEEQSFHGVSHNALWQW